MSLAIPDFWKLVVESRLLSSDQCQKLEAEFGGVKGATNSTNAKALAEWLVSRQALSRYQSTVLLAGRPGPFYYGDYRVYDRVDSGNLKGQFRAIHAPSGHPVMLRFLAGSVLKDNREWALVAARVQKQAGVVYPLLQRYFEPVDLQAFRFLATEDLHGETLDEVLAKHGRLPPMEAARLIRLAAFGLSYLHQLGIVHGDVRPAQLLLEPSGNVKLLIDPAQVHGAVNVALLDPSSPAAARVDYLAPEFLQANKTPDAQTDIYALGCTFYQLLTGTVPFPGGLPGQKLARHAAEPIQPLEPYGVPHPLAQLVAFMMAKNPAVRTQQMAIIAEQLVPYIDPARLQLPPSTPPATLSTFESWIKQKQAVLTNAAKVQSAPATPAVTIDVTKKSDAKPTEAKTGVAITATKPMVSQRAASSSKTSGKNQQTMLIGGGVAAAALAVVLVIIMANSGGDDLGDGSGGKTVVKKPDDAVPTTNVSSDIKPAERNPTTNNTNTNTNTNVSTKPSEKVPTPEVPVAKFDVQPDDGKLLWASPTSGSAIDFNNVPPNAQIFVIARPAEMLASPSGQQVIESLGPNFAAQRAAWEKSAGVKLADVTQLVIALHDAGGTVPRPSYRITLRDPLVEGDLLKLWGNPQPQDINGNRYFAAGGRAFYVPDGGGSFVMGDPADIKEVAAAKGSPPVLRREIDQLRKLSDSDRHVTLLVAPNYLTTGARDLFAGPYEKLRGPIEWFLGDEAKSAMLSMHFGDTFYIEMREIANVDLEKTKLAADLKAKLAEMPKYIEDYINNLNAPAYWKRVATRYPGMIYFLHRQTRVGVEDEVAIVNAAAPGALAHNLFFGGELALASTPGVMVATAGSPTTENKPKTLDELLKKKTSFEVPRNDMNLAMADLEKEVKSDSPDLPFEFVIKIIGKDLEGEGITRNQAIANFRMDGAPLADILTGLVRKANPVTTVKDPSEVDQKLIWVVGPDPDKPDKQVILITTRKAAGEKKYTLPPAFVAKK